MIIHARRITIVKVTKPIVKDINKELQWFGHSLGLFNMRDKDKSQFRIFIELLKAAKQREPLSSDELAEKIGITRGTVIHHLHKLMELGIVARDKKGYLLSVDNLSSLINELERDIHRTCMELRKVAIEIDRGLGL